MIHDYASHDLPDDEDDCPILLHGVSLPQTDDLPPPIAIQADSEPETLTLRPFDDGVPGRDYQPRLFRFGEAA